MHNYFDLKSGLQILFIYLLGRGGGQRLWGTDADECQAICVAWLKDIQRQREAGHERFALKTI